MMHIYFREEPRAFIFVSSSAVARGKSESRERTALVLSTHTRRHAGVGGNSSTSSTSSINAHRAVIETVSLADIPELVSLRKVHTKAFGCLGLINVGHDLFFGIVDRAASVGEVRPGEPVMRITSVQFHCLNKNLWDGSSNEFSTDGTAIGYDQISPSTIELGQQQFAAQASSNSNGSLIEHPCASMRKLLANGTFYFAQDAQFDISRRLAQRANRGLKEDQPTRLISPATENPPVPESSSLSIYKDGGPGIHHDRSSPDKSFDTRFVWNTYMMEALQDYRSRLDTRERLLFDNENFLLPVIQGYVGSAQVGSATIALISRLSWKRAGTRFATRGVDDDGNAANFAESETLYSYEGKTMSYCQVRGSVPLFWEQQGLQAFNARIQITRSRAASQPAFDRHFAELLTDYKHVHALNLLGTRDAETVLTNAYAEHMRHSEAEEVFLSSKSKEDGIVEHEQDPLERVGLTNFDFHSSTRMNGGLDGVKLEIKRLGPIQRKREAFRYTIVDENSFCTVRQQGVFRVNCLDCLDRTNVVQDILSQGALTLCVDQADKGGLADAGSALWVSHRTLWAENGDALSRIYAGTGALNSNFTRTGVGKKTLGGLLSDAAKSASRLYINNFQDKSKQNVIDALLGNMAHQRPVSVFDPIHDAVNADLDERLDEFSTIKQVTVFTGTWNLAGRGPSGENLEPFLFATDVEPDILAVGLQEVVPLTPQQILLTDPDKLRTWERTIANAVAQRQSKGSEKHTRYIPLRSEQLVGTGLIILIRDTLLPFVRQVEAATKKTGLKGMSGNKGGVAIRMNIYDTNFCFVTAHLAAGKSNVEERNADFHTISRELTFQSGRDIHGAHHTFWFGDFNYRIDGTNELVRPLCERGDFSELTERDQLVKAQATWQAFNGYTEGQLIFPPTYKYDFNSQRYDTSEKMRVPAWTDRVLNRSRYPFNSHLLLYDRAELFTSDHRPVFALYQVDARQYDTEQRNKLRRELLAKYKAANGSRDGTGVLLGESMYMSDEDEDVEDDYDTDELPDPSSDNGTLNWWDKALSCGEDDEDNSDDDKGSDSSREERRMDVNPFLRSTSGKRRQSAVQYAMRRTPKTDSSRSGPTSSSSNRGHSPLPPTSSSMILEGGKAGLRKDSPLSTSWPNATAQPPNAARQGGNRRPPPEPPSSTSSKDHSLLAPANSISTNSVKSRTSPAATSTTTTTTGYQTYKSAPPLVAPRKSVPPSIPSKPSNIALRARQSEGSGGGAKPADAVVAQRPILTGPKAMSNRAGTNDVAAVQASPPPAPPPKIPARPGLGARSQSYQSTKSQRSLLDDSD